MLRNQEFPIGTTPLVEKEFKSIRVKVTEKCQWQCAFCHDEGNRQAVDIQWGPKIEEAVEALRQALPSLTEVHYTGGEPTKNADLPELTAALTALGFEVKTTSNGQFSKETMERLIEAGITSFNFSLHSLDPERFLRFQVGRGTWWKQKKNVSGPEKGSSKYVSKPIKKLQWAKQQIERELSNILDAKEMGVASKVNTVISTQDDIENAREIFSWCKKNDVPLRLLNDLGNGHVSVDAIRVFVSSVDAKEVLRKATTGSSSCSTVYRDKDGYEFVFKQIRNMKLQSMCEQCPRNENGTCEEQFYGIRLQLDEEGVPKVLLCIQEIDQQSEMTVPEFLDSEQIRNIQSIISDF